MTMQRLYKLLIRLHPKAFRDRFGSEMLFTFEEARQTEGPTRLITDGVLSVLRQWIVSSRNEQSALRVSENASPMFALLTPGGPSFQISRLILGGVISLWLFLVLLGRGEPHLSALHPVLMHIGSATNFNTGNTRPGPIRPCKTFPTWETRDSTRQYLPSTAEDAINEKPEPIELWHSQGGCLSS
jgi:hypothetical protein